MARILAVDDDRTALIVLAGILKSGGHEVLALLRADRLIEEAKAFNAELMVIDILLPGTSGAELYKLIRSEMGADLPIIVSSGTTLKIRLPEDPLLAYCPKPVQSALIKETVTRLLAACEARRAGHE